MSASVDDLVRAGRLQRVEPDRDAAYDKLQEGKQHLRSASTIAEDDPPGAYALLYDAARKAIDAHMLAGGYRVPKDRLGAHATTAEYAVLFFTGGEYSEDVGQMDRMRRNRNRSEYGSWHIGPTLVERDLKFARRLVRAVDKALA